MQHTPRPTDWRHKTTAMLENKKLANTAIIGASALLVAGIGVAFWQDEQAQARSSESVSSYTPPAAADADVEVIRFAAVGDSITEANSPDIVERRVGDASWVSYAESKSTRYAGGWADGGAQTSSMRENFEPIDGSDVLVVLAGANDVANDVPFDETAANIEAIVDESAAPRVIVSSIPPQDEDPGRVVAFNEELEAFAQDNGWEWVDAAAGLRDGDEYADGLSNDGIHPTADGARILGDAIQEAITTED